MHARFYSSQMGRFLSVDPKRSSALPSAPQTWNRFSYALGSPLKFVDPDGRDAVLVIVSEGGDFKEVAGHAALWVGNDDNGFGISVFGGVQFEGKTAALNDFVSKYAENRTVTTYLLRTSPAEDARMVEFMKGDPTRAGIDDTQSIVRENCSKAIANTLTAGGVISHQRAVALDILGVIYSPDGLERSAKGGALSDRLTGVRLFTPTKRKSEDLHEADD